MKLTLQIHDVSEGWLTAAELEFLSEREVRIEYDLDFATAYLGRTDICSLSLTFPVQLDPRSGHPPGFLLDLIPQGNALRQLLARHNIRHENDYLRIFAEVPLASPGNLRVREPWQRIDEERANYKHPGFTRQEVIDAKLDFIDYMEDHGAPVGGTSGAAGGAPKFLLREDLGGRLHADGYLDDDRTKTSWLIKFPFTDSHNSKLLVQTEKKYYDVLRELPLYTGDAIEIESDILFIKRFDRVRLPHDKRLHYLGLESFYSAHDISTYGSILSHEANLQLIERFSSNPQVDVCEYLKRDLVYRALANTDNHGRNTSFIKKNGSVMLSPIYDVTAMRFFDGDFIVSLTRWSDKNRALDERLRWIEQHLEVDAEKVRKELSSLKSSLKGLEALLIKHEVATEIIRRSQEDFLAVMKELKDI